MAKGIFDTRSESGYDDDIVERYQFPKRYLSTAQRFVGDWIVYREPRAAGGRSGYVAVARVTRTEPDPARPDRTYAYLDRFLPFDNVVPTQQGGRYMERWLDVMPDKTQVGRA